MGDSVIVDIPLGMYRSVERNNAFRHSASRQGCILNRMQVIDIITFSTERCIPTEYNFRNSLYYILFILHT
jgi:hypothetical protein